MSDERKPTISELLLQKEKDGKIVFATIDGLMEQSIDEFIQQPVEGMLYDLNRDKVTALHLAQTDPRGVNDFAVAVVITRLVNDLFTLRAENVRLWSALTSAYDLLSNSPNTNIHDWEAARVEWVIDYEIASLGGGE